MWPAGRAHLWLIVSTSTLTSLPSVQNVQFCHHLYDFYSKSSFSLPPWSTRGSKPYNMCSDMI